MASARPARSSLTVSRTRALSVTVSRKFVAMTEHALADLLAADLSTLDLVAFMVDGVHFAEPSRSRCRLRRVWLHG